MNSILIISFILFGFILGSFLNVLILRYNTGRGFGGRSMCFSCGRTLSTRDLVPVLSFLMFRGRCRTCKAKISKQYVLVELVTAGLFLLAYLHNAPLLQAAWDSGVFPVLFLTKVIIDCAIMFILVFMAAYDLRHKIIPDPYVFTFSGLALLSTLVTLLTTDSFHWMILLAGPILAFPFYLIWLLSGGRWMGLGDAKLALGIGWMLGLSAGGSAIIFGFWAGALISILIMITFRLMQIHTVRRAIRKFGIPHLTLKSEVPFAPFLIVGLLIVYIFGYNIFVLSF